MVPAQVVERPFVEALKLRAVDYYRLTKPNLTLLVVITTLLGLALSVDVAVPTSLLIATVLGTALSAGGACALNMAMETEYDRLMPRTAARPLPEQRVTDSEAVVLGMSMVTAGGIVLWMFANPLTGLLSLLAAAVYIFAYTPLKRVSPWATVVGAIPGALPPMMGYTAVSGTIGLEALIVFGILFFWQLPHFWALAILYRNDYDRGGFRLWPGAHIDRYIIGTTFTLVLVSAALYAVKSAGLIYLGGALLLGSWFLQRAFALGRNHNRDTARALFLASIAYLPLLILVLIADKPRLFLVVLGLADAA
jgi:protoheme IX farnesyltransferase